MKDLDYRCKELHNEISAKTNDFDEKMADFNGNTATAKIRQSLALMKA